MKRTQLVLAITLVSALASALVAAETKSADAQESYEMKIATVAPEGTPWEKQLRKIRRYIGDKTGGRVRVKMFMGGSLGGEKALVRRTAQGGIQCFGGSTAALASLVPELNVVEAPYLFNNAAQADRALDHAEVLGKVREAVEARGFKFGFWAENGFRSWFTKDRAIRTPADLNGLRMRSQEAHVHLAAYRAFGANPVPIDVTNVLTSLQTNVVDGFDKHTALRVCYVLVPGSTSSQSQRAFLPARNRRLFEVLVRWVACGYPTTPNRRPRRVGFRRSTQRSGDGPDPRSKPRALWH